MSNPPIYYLVAGFVAFFIGLSKGGFGGALGALATPLMALVMPVSQVIGLNLPILILGDTFALLVHWRRWRFKLVLLLLPGAIVGISAGTFFITNVPTRILQITLGLIILIFAVYKLLEKRIAAGLAYRPQRWHGVLAGTVSGFSSALAHTGAPPISIYLLLQNIPPRTFVATSVLFFAIVNWVKVPYYLYAQLFDWQLLAALAWLLPLVPLGAWVGRRFTARLKKAVFDRMIVFLLVVSAVLLLLDFKFI